MTCPACNYELLAHSDGCENCGAPAYLATAIQASEVIHCTYCGARDDAGQRACPVCGLKKNFQMNACVIGTCRNCGAAWHNTWLYCQTCGVPRENGLVDTTTPLTTHFPAIEPVRKGDSSARSFPSPFRPPRLTDREPVSWPSYQNGEAEDDASSMAEVQSLLSEHEVVERMFVNGESGNPARREVDLTNFLSFSNDDAPIASPHSGPASGHETMSGMAASAVYDLPVVNREAAPVAPPAQSVKPEPAKAEAQTVSALPAVTEPVKTKPVPTSDMPPAASPPAPMKAEPLPPDGSGTAASVEKPVAAPVQAVKILDQPRAGAPPPVDKGLVKIIALLIGLILIFSALIVSGFRLRDLFGRAPAPSPPPARPPATTRSNLAPTVAENAPPAPAGMVYLPGGTFPMGTEAGDSFEAPVHEVTVTPFFMDQTEVTNEQYAEFIKAAKHAAPPDWQGETYPAGTAKFPVVQVSWRDANDYATWAGKRLPTEVEWEFAARTTDGRRYPWGATWETNQANTSESQLDHPIAVGSYPSAAHPFGLLDMAGNVWEWTVGDVVSYKDPSVALAPGKVIRGGAFYAPKERATTTYRGFAPPDKKATGIGFRCVKEVN